MKAILISIQSPHACNILNLIKLWEIRKKFPKDYVGWVYIYVTKALSHLSKTRVGNYEVYDDTQWDKEWLDLNGKVVARFWCDKVEEHRPFFHWCIEKETCLTRDDVLDYLDSKDKSVGNPKRQGKVYAIHITNLEIFDKPKEISEFYALGRTSLISGWVLTPNFHRLTRAPQSWCYIEV